MIAETILHLDGHSCPLWIYFLLNISSREVALDVANPDKKQTLPGKDLELPNEMVESPFNPEGIQKECRRGCGLVVAWKCWVNGSAQ